MSGENFPEIGPEDHPPRDEAYWRAVEADMADDQGRGGSNVTELFPESRSPTYAPAARLIPASQLLARPTKRRPWLVEDMIPGKQVCEVRGDGGAGKSTLALQLCASAVTGRSWLGTPVARGPAIYLASEDDEDELQRRLDAIAVHLQVQRDDLVDLHVWPLAIEDPTLAEPGEDGIEGTARWDQLEAHIERIEPVVIVLDSRADVFGGEEINRKQVVAFVRMLRNVAVRTGAAIIILAHPSLVGKSNRTGSSGSTHWNNAVRSALNLTKPDGDEGFVDPDLRTLEVVKNNYARIGAPITLRMTAGAFVVAEGSPMASLTREEADARVDEVFLRLVDRYNAEGRRLSDLASKAYAPVLFARDPDAGGVKKAAFEVSMTRLFRATKIRVVQSGPPSKLVRQLIRAPDCPA